MTDINMIKVVISAIFVVYVLLNKTLIYKYLESNTDLFLTLTGINAGVRITDIPVPILCVLVIPVSFLLYQLWVLLFRPLNRVRILGDIGYQREGKFTMKETSEMVKKRRVVGQIPPVYPNGWFAIIEGWRLQSGETTSIHAFGQDLAVFRDDNGEAHVLDAYCPHMGANLAVGGRVVGSCIECPFHGWKFRGHDGKCAGIPYADKIPDIAKVKSWTSKEINGWINVWYHAEGKEPYWTLPEINAIMDGTYQYKGRTEHHINAHIQEIPENGSDAAHLNHIHRPFLAAGNDPHTMWDTKMGWTQHKWEATWSHKPHPEEHVGCMNVTHDVTVFGFSLLRLFKLNVKAFQYGPAIVYITMEHKLFKCYLIHVVTPMEPLLQKVVQTIYVHWAMPNIIAKTFLAGDGVQLDRDTTIWNNKKYQNKPVFSKAVEDSYIARFRRWYSQFYSEHSPRINSQRDILDW